MQAKSNKEFSVELKKRIYRFILNLIKFIDVLPKNDPLCRVVIDQMLRSGTSVGANYVEAIAASSKREFANFLRYSLKSCNETKFWLAITRDTGRGNVNKINNLLSEITEISNILATSIRTMKRN
ncbi:MAG: hypothetical protein CEN89_365 [Candidatus Berkelbacteria bacterium Licking1014_7]|uniref:S23 ribosomal protein n=1 Tax=Candidatus Berkelbacteria bacterium Licking1014_7 TaxID=2017147 RepID=A0A554LJG6_9BACT|nr:MAG: hypothetical protein CEN89_365 [Candidatus Berkelbacteria bacterium Licking1014_7]